MTEMKRSRPSFWFRGWALVALFVITLPLLAQYDPKLQYQNRGNRHEGLKPKPVSGYAVELLSALVDYREPSPTWPPTLRLRFYLPTAEPAFIIVRQPRPRTTYYWLDKAVPAAPWRPRAFNEFSWETASVLRNLPRMTVEELGAVVRLGREDGSQREWIAPAALFHTQPPTTASGYRFTFKTNGSAYVTAKIYRGETMIYHRPQNRERPGSPFTLSWAADGHTDGEYRLVVSGYFDDNTQLAKEIVFHHRASWR